MRITSSGFNMPTENEVFDEVVDTAGEEGIKIIENSNDYFISKFLGNYFFKMYQNLNQVRINNNPYEAEGEALENLAILKSIEKIKPAKASVIINITLKTNNTAYSFAEGEIKIGDDENKFVNTNSFELLASSRPININFTSETTGAKNNVNSNQIINIESDPSNQIQSVTNLSNARGGQDLETDNDFRIRLLNSYPSVLSVVRLEKALRNLDVRYARVVNNYTDTTEANGVPFEHTAIVVDDSKTSGNFDVDLAKQIWEAIRDNSVTNEKWHSTGAIPITYSHNGLNVTYPVHRPTPKSLEFEIDIKSRENKPVTLDQQIISKISDLVKNKNSGEPIKASDFFSKIIEIKDLRDSVSVSVKMRKKGDSTYSFFIDMLYNELPSVATTDIAINYGAP